MPYATLFIMRVKEIVQLALMVGLHRRNSLQGYADLRIFPTKHMLGREYPEIGITHFY